MKVSSRLLEEVFRIRLQKTSSRHLQDVLIKAKYTPYLYVFRRRLHDIFKASWLRTICKSWSYVFKTSSRRFQDVLKTSSIHLQDVLQRCLQDVFNTCYQFKLFLSCSVLVFKSFWDALLRRFSTAELAWVTLLRNLWSVCKIYKSDKSFSKFSFSLYCTFQWLL